MTPPPVLPESISDSALDAMTPSSTIKSPPTIPRFSFQSLSNFISVPSLSWPPRYSSSSESQVSPPAPLCNMPSLISPDPKHKVLNAVNAGDQSQPLPRGLVPKERQLEKLRMRMEQERSSRLQGGNRDRVQGQVKGNWLNL